MPTTEYELDVGRPGSDTLRFPTPADLALGVVTAMCDPSGPDPLTCKVRAIDGDSRRELTEAEWAEFRASVEQNTEGVSIDRVSHLGPPPA